MHVENDQAIAARLVAAPGDEMRLRPGRALLRAAVSVERRERAFIGQNDHG